MYAMTVENETKAMSLGKILDENEEAIFHCEKVRCMSWEEEKLYNEDRLSLLVDLWGNVAVDKDSDVDFTKLHVV